MENKEYDASITVPQSHDGVRQEGVVPAGRRKYGAKYEAVTLEEAMKRMKERKDGSRKVIAGGLDDKTVGEASSHSTVSVTSQSAKPVATESLVAYSLEPSFDDCPSPVVEHHKTASEEMYGRLAGYFGKSREVSIQVRLDIAGGLRPVGTFSFTALDVVEDDIGVCVVCKSGGDKVSFSPAPGSDVLLSYGGGSIHCYYPGLKFDISGLGVCWLGFIKAEGDN